MDPLAALALAGNILQFVQFAAGLLVKTQKIHRAASGTSHHWEDEQDVEGVYARLLSFSSLLKGPDPSSNSADTVEASVHAVALSGLVQECRGCCDRLLEITRKLQVKGDSKAKWWR